MIMTGMLLLSACSDENSEETFFLQGAWTLRHVEYPIGTEYDYPQDGTTFCRIYDRDSTLYECHLSETQTGLVIVPHFTAGIVFADHGDRLMYLEDEDPRPLTIKNDSTIVIQRNGQLIALVKFEDNVLDWNLEGQDRFIEDLERRKQEILDFVNSHVNRSSRIKEVEVEKQPFVKTATMKIKRFLYKEKKNENNKQ